jgi:hypothetical protein
MQVEHNSLLAIRFVDISFSEIDYMVSVILHMLIVPYWEYHILPKTIYDEPYIPMHVEVGDVYQ